MSAATMAPPASTSTPPPLMTGEEFLRSYGDERGVELVRGVVRRKAMPGALHGYVNQRVTVKIGTFVEQHDSGYLLTHDTFVRTEVSPPSFRGPDIQFFSFQRLPKGSLPVGVPDIPPDLAIEVRSPSETWKSLTRKALEYLDADVKVVVLFDPDDKTATVFRADGKSHTYAEDQTLTLPDVLPGFALPLAAVFA